MNKPIDVKIAVNKKEANWISVLEQSEALVIKGEADLVINKLIVKTAKRCIKEEQDLNK